MRLMSKAHTTEADIGIWYMSVDVYNRENPAGVILIAPFVLSVLLYATLVRDAWGFKKFLMMISVPYILLIIFLFLCLVKSLFPSSQLVLSSSYSEIFAYGYYAFLLLTVHLYMAEPLYGTQALLAIPTWFAFLGMLSAKLDDWGSATWVTVVTPLAVLVVTEALWTYLMVLPIRTEMSIAERLRRKKERRETIEHRRSLTVEKNSRVAQVRDTSMDGIGHKNRDSAKQSPEETLPEGAEGQREGGAES